MDNSRPRRDADSRDDLGHQFGRVEERLIQDFADRVPAGFVRQCVQAARAEFAQARVVQFVPVLVERLARRRLRDTAAFRQG
jgi:hypothetical protein